MPAYIIDGDIVEVLRGETEVVGVLDDIASGHLRIVSGGHVEIEPRVASSQHVVQHRAKEEGPRRVADEGHFHQLIGLPHHFGLACQHRKLLRHRRSRRVVSVATAVPIAAARQIGTAAQRKLLQDAVLADSQTHQPIVEDDHLFHL
jgi:hypothetical protein